LNAADEGKPAVERGSFLKKQTVLVLEASRAEIKQGMVLGADKNVHVEPAIWMIERARNHYGYPVTRSN
jgi:hypothetical protein